MVFIRDISRLEGEGEDTVARVGQGGYGTVHLGAVRGTVVKRAHPRKYGAFMRELLLLSYLGPHPQLVSLRNYHLQDALLVLERWTSDLWHVLMENKGTHNERRQVLHDVLRGLAYLHSRDVVHADVKSSNVVVKVEHQQSGVDGGIHTVSVRAALIDLGLAAPSHYASVHLTTPPYREPQARASWHHDIYSAGLVGLELFAGISWTSTPAYEAALSVVPRVRSIALRLVLQGMLTEDRERRLSAAEALSVLTSENVSPPFEAPRCESRESEATAAMARVLHAYDAGELCEDGEVERETMEQVVVGMGEALYYGVTAPLTVVHERAMDLVLMKCPHLLMPQ